MNSNDSKFKVKFIKRGRICPSRKREIASSEDGSSNSDGEESIVVHRETKHKTNPNIQRTKNLRTKYEADAAEAGSGDEAGPTDTGGAALSVIYKSTGQKDSTPNDMGATRTYEFDTEFNKDAQAIFERSAEVNKSLKGESDDKLYRGINNYVKYIDKKDSALGNASSGLVRKGPVRAPANIRSTVRWDYQPDTCKDYKETGYCGFGDSCKFAHDRGDYKAGWQLEQEEKDGPANKDEQDYAISSDDEDLPFKCYLCRKTFVSPIITKCKHYFCEKCALAQYRKSKRCFVCGLQTFGVFNPAKDLLDKIHKKKHKKKNKKERDSSGLESESDTEDKDYVSNYEDTSSSDEDIDLNQPPPPPTS